MLDTYTLGEALNSDMETGNTSEKNSATPQSQDTTGCKDLSKSPEASVFGRGVLLGLQISLFLRNQVYIYI